MLYNTPGHGHRSHPSRGAWIEIPLRGLCARCGWRRTPHGVRGLKYAGKKAIKIAPESHPSRGAWIEIFADILAHQMPAGSHPSRGAWIEIGRMTAKDEQAVSRTPHGVRGLKFRFFVLLVMYRASHPSRGAWIEMIGSSTIGMCMLPSHPSRGAWIEIFSHANTPRPPGRVAPLTGCVD